jgi:TonB family protein
MHLSIIRFTSTLFLLLLFATATSQTNPNKNSDSSTTSFCTSFLTYPQEAADDGIYGTVIILFDVDSNCSIKNIRIEKGIGHGCDEEAVRVVKECRKEYAQKLQMKCKPKLNLRIPITFSNPSDD